MVRISVVGLGKLGSPLVVSFAQRGFEVFGIDTNRQVVNLINQGKAPVNEPKLQNLLTKNHHRIKATDDFEEAIGSSDITFIVVPTPSQKNGAFSNRHVLSAIKNIGQALAKKSKYHLVVVSSTILPFSMDQEIVSTILKYSNKKLISDFGLCYNPEFIALGSAIDNLLKPDLVLIGESDEKAGSILEKFYRQFCQNKPPIVRMNFINAEVTKIALNSYITTKISFANTLAQIAQNIPGGDVDQVTDALGLDSRIGKKYLKGALPYGGPCFPRDNRAFVYFAQKLKLKAPLAQATDQINEKMVRSLTSQLIATLKKKDKVSILGLAYKKDTDVAEESAGVKMANILAKNNFRVSAWDPKAKESATSYLSPEIILAKSLQECLAKAAVIIIATPWDEFKRLRPADLNSGGKKPILIDCWRILNPLKYEQVADYRTIGQDKFKIASAN